MNIPRYKLFPYFRSQSHPEHHPKNDKNTKLTFLFVHFIREESKKTEEMNKKVAKNK